MITGGQKQALEDLDAIAAASDGALSVGPERDESGYRAVALGASMQGVRRYGGGLPIGETEDLEIWIPRNFPLEAPLLFASDYRFAEYGHVTGSNLCLYLDSASQWSPSDGMFGFVDRMAQWFVDAAAGRLDPDGAPVHPPVTVGLGYSSTQLLVRVDIPPGSQRRLLWANLEPVSNSRVDVIRFHRHKPDVTERVAAVILANSAIRGDYVGQWLAFIAQLNDLGFEKREIVQHIIEVAALNPQGSPLIVIVGTLNRGTSGDRHHHLVAWELSEDLADRLRGLSDPDDEDLDEHLEVLNTWAASEPLQWIHVNEARPAVTRRRDGASSMSAFRGRTVEIWGCGALGGWIAEFVARAQPARLVLRDHGRVGAGLIVRQPYGEADVTTHKATALAKRLEAIDPTIDIVSDTTNLVQAGSENRDLESVDVLINATANRSVSVLLERSVAACDSPPIAMSVVTDARAQRGALFATRPVAGVGPGYVEREALREMYGQDEYSHFVDAFWSPVDLADLVQAEPGCSAPTFHGSAADTAGVAAVMANLIADFIDGDSAGTADLASSPTLSSAQDLEHSFHARYGSPLCVGANDGYRIVVTPQALKTMRAAIADSFNEVPPSETGGALFGQRDRAARVVWIDDASRAPIDSDRSPGGFVRGVEGIDALAASIEATTHHQSTYIGDWHTHPDGAAAMSPTDHKAAAKLPADGASVILIRAGALDKPQWTAHVMKPTAPRNAVPVNTGAGPVAASRPGRSRALGQDVVGAPCDAPMPPRTTLPPVADGDRPLILALSGGGFRATLAAVGVLRFLADADLLRNVRLVSGVSGGSIATGILASQWSEARNQPVFDTTVVGPALKGVAGSSFFAELVRQSWRAALPGRTRTTVLADRLDRRFFDGQLLEDLPRGCWFMFNATNVDEGVRFRFDADVVGDYVVGSVPTTGTRLRLATAVAASAAVPGYFPPLVLRDVAFPCGDSHGVRLVDGGIYDNLGLEAVLRERAELSDAFVVSLNAGMRLDRDSAAGLGRVPLAGALWRANSVMHRQTSALRTRRLYQEFHSSKGRTGVAFNLASAFNEGTLSDAERGRLEAWRSVNAEHTPVDRATLSALPTSFYRIDRATAEALIHRSWWLCGATIWVYHPGALTGMPRWQPLDRGL